VKVIYQYDSVKNANDDIKLMQDDGIAILEVNVAQSPGRDEDGEAYMIRSIIVVAEEGKND
jgi:hypothetical protein